MILKTTSRSEQIEQDLYRDKEPIEDDQVGEEPPIDTEETSDAPDDIKTEQPEIF